MFKNSSDKIFIYIFKISNAWINKSCSLLNSSWTYQCTVETRILGITNFHFVILRASETHRFDEVKLHNTILDDFIIGAAISNRSKSDEST